MSSSAIHAAAARSVGPRGAGNSPAATVVSARIVEVGAHPPPRGGWSIRIELLKNGLRAAGHTCIVLNIGPSRRTPSLEYETVAGLLDFTQKVFRYARQRFVIHTHANGELNKGFALALLAQAICRMFGAPSVLTFHAGIDQPYFPKENSRLMAPLFTLIFALADRIVCNSEPVKRKIGEYGMLPAKITPIPAFTRQYLDFAPVPPSPEVAEFFGRCGEVLFTYVRMQSGYYLETLADGFARIAARRPGTGLLIVGVDRRAATGALRTFLDDPALSARVCVVVDVDHDEFLTLLTKSAVYLRTPTSDGIAASVLEALALGVPVVASQNGTRPASVITYNATDPKALADSVCNTLEYRDEIARTMVRPELPDTLSDEIRLLTSTRTL